jgi:hypothetical protein
MLKALVMEALERHLNCHQHGNTHNLLYFLVLRAGQFTRDIREQTRNMPA